VRQTRRGRLNRQVAALIHAGHGDDIDRSPHQIGGQCRNAIVSTFRPPVLDRHVSTLGEALFIQAAAKRRQYQRVGFGRPAVEPANDGN
jgi:hypothetical protein